MPHILAIGLEKFKSVACAYPRGGGAHAFRTIEATEEEAAAHLARVRLAVVVIEACPSRAWCRASASRASWTRRGKGPAAHALRLAAWSLMRSKSHLGAYLRRQRGRPGAPKAMTATAHKLAQIVYHLMRYGAAYAQQHEEAYAAEVRQRQEKQ